MSNSKHEHCLVCQGTGLKKLPAYSKHFLVKCQNCGFVFCENIPDVEELSAYYQVYAYGAEDKISAITKERYLELLKSFSGYRKTNNLLDIGCGTGHFLECACSEGWNVFGTEMSQLAIDKCRQKSITVFENINNAEFEEEMFDVITLYEVLEHVNNPVEMLGLIKKLLRKGGVLYLTTPNFNSLLRHLSGSDFNIVMYPEHLGYFTVKTLKSLTAAYSFEKIAIKTTGFSISRFKKGNKNEQNTSKSTDYDELFRNKAAQNKLFATLKTLVNFILNIFRLGDTLKGTFIKK